MTAAAAPSPEPPVSFWNRPSYLIGILAFVQIATSTDNTGLTNSMSGIASDLDATVAEINVTTVVYPLMAGATMLIFGTAGLFTGYKRLLQGGLVLLIAGEIVAAASPDVQVLTYVARTLTGLGAGAAIPSVIALMAVLFTGELRARAYGVLGAATGIAVIAAPILSGVVIEVAGWRWLFILLAVMFAIPLLGTLRVDVPKTPRPSTGFDAPGALFAGAGIVIFLFGVMNLSTWGIFRSVDAPFTIYGYSPAPLIAVSGLLLIGWALHYERERESRGESVVLPSAFLTRESRSALLVTGYYFGAFGAFGFVIVTYLQIFLGATAIVTGLIISLFAVSVTAASSLGPRLFKNPDIRGLIRVAMLVVLVVEFSMLVVINLDLKAVLALTLVPAGLAFGLVLGFAPTIVTSILPSRFQAQSGGVQGSARNVSQAIGTAVAGVSIAFAMTFITQAQVAAAPDISNQAKTAIKAQPSIPVVSENELDQAAKSAGLSSAQTQELKAINRDAQQKALTGTTIATIAFSALFLLATGGLPRRLGPASATPESASAPDPT